MVRTGAGATPPSDRTLPELSGRLATADSLRAQVDVSLSRRKPDREVTIELKGGMEKYDWSLDNRSFTLDKPMSDPYRITTGERVRLNFVNTTEM